MKARMKSPAMTMPGAMEAIMALVKSVETCGVSRATIEFVNMRASLINGCSVCVDMHSRALKKMGEKDERIFSVSGGSFQAVQQAALLMFRILAQDMFK